MPIHVSEVVSELSARGHEIHVITCLKNKSVIEKLPIKNIRLHNLKTINVRFISELLFMFFLLPYLFLLTLIHRPNIFYVRHSATSLIATIVASFFRKPCLIEINDIVIDKLKFIDVSKIKLLWIKLYHYCSYRLASHLLPVTEQIYFWILDHYRIKRERVTVVSNGVNIHRFIPKPLPEARLRYNLPLDAEIILSLGSLFPWAGIENLIDAAPKVLEHYPNTLFVVGSGEEPYHSNLKKAVNESGLDGHFLFFNFIPWDDAAWFISIANICVAPFVFKKIRSGVSSLRVFAYLGCGKPVIGTDIPGLGDMLESNCIGLSFPMNNYEALSDAIITLLSDSVKLKEMGKRGRKFVVNNYSWEVIVDKIEDKCNELIMAKKR